LDLDDADMIEAWEEREIDRSYNFGIGDGLGDRCRYEAIDARLAKTGGDCILTSLYAC